MLLSGFYEAYLDYIILGFIQEKLDNNRLTIDMKARLLFVILCGNLDLEPDATSSDQQMLDWTSREQDENDKWPNFRGDPGNEPRNPSSPWTHIENLVHPLRTYRDSKSLSHWDADSRLIIFTCALQTPRQWPMHDSTCSVPNCTDFKCNEVPISRSPQVLREVGRAKTRVWKLQSHLLYDTSTDTIIQLRTMLACRRYCAKGFYIQFWNTLSFPKKNSSTR